MTFIFWGLFHAFFLITERLMEKKSFYKNLPALPSIVITNVIVLFGWALFRAPDLSQAVHYWRAMTGTLTPNAASLLLYSELFTLRHIVTMAVCAIVMWQPVQAFEWVKNRSAAKYALLIILLLLSIAAMFSQSFNPFLYFQF
jgi:alginate O-acetyltransferase complex protein AlgI